jgi:hypothetical protein
MRARRRRKRSNPETRNIKKENQRFFFEKKKQKTSAKLDDLTRPAPTPAVNKIFVFREIGNPNFFSEEAAE